VLASATGIARHANDVARERPGGPFDQAHAAGEDFDARWVIGQAQAGNVDAVEAIRRAGRYLGVGLASFANIFNPEVILIGGGASAAGELLIGPARDEMMRRGLGPTTEDVRVAIAELGNDAGVLGAAEIAFELVADRKAA
jgi:glucokinase